MIKSFTAQRIVILLNEFPVTFQCFIFVRSPIKLIHNFDAYAIHCSTEMLDNMKAIENDFSIWKKFSSNIVVGTKHVHGNDFHATSYLSRIPKEMIANSCLSPSIYEGYSLGA